MPDTAKLARLTDQHSTLVYDHGTYYVECTCGYQGAAETGARALALKNGHRLTHHDGSTK